MSNNLPLFDICGLVKAIKLIYLTINFISIELNFSNTIILVYNNFYTFQLHGRLFQAQRLHWEQKVYQPDVRGPKVLLRPPGDEMRKG